jgi:crossover junction endodeoxyribonuclease RusA
VTFSLARPAGHYGTGRNAGIVRAGAPEFPATRPDLDKLARSTLDGLKSAGLYGDDGQVVILNVNKRYCLNGEPPGAGIEIREVAP